MKVIFHPDAKQELAEQVEYLRSYGILPDAAELFTDEIARAVEQIRMRPQEHRLPGGKIYFRAGPTKRFSHSVIYRISDETIEILAVAASPRRPGYWPTRGV